MNFVALGVIAEIDDLYARTLHNSQVKRRILEGENRIIMS